MLYAVIGILTAFVVVLLVLLIITAVQLRKVKVRFAPIVEQDKELKRLKDEQDRALKEHKKEREKLEREREGLKNEISKARAKWETEFSSTIKEYEELSKQVEYLNELGEFQAFGVYEPVFDFDTSQQYKEAVKEIRSQQKQMIKDGTAAVCDTNWTVSGSAAKGRQMVKKYIKLQLRAFHGEADAAISKARFDNVVRLRERLTKSFDAINKLGETNEIRITREYLDKKIAELNLAFELAQKKQAEKEEQAAIRVQMREEAAAKKEIQKLQLEAEREEVRYQKALETARKEFESASDKKQEELKKKIALLEKQFEEAHEKKARAVSRAQLTKSGHVYIISNIGSFGSDVFKIGMTRRLEPLDRVKELGDASVPFRFDTHAMIYSDDAPALESELHKRFASREMNRVNTKREFYRVTLAEIEEVVRTICGDDVEFIRTAVAEEYRQSDAIRRKEEAARQVELQKMEDQRVASAKNRFEQLKGNWKADPIG